MKTLKTWDTHFGPDPLEGRVTQLQEQKICYFCKQNKEEPGIYLSHNVETCAILLNVNCTGCGLKGHTLSRCKAVPNPVSVSLRLKRTKNNLSKAERKALRVVADQ